MDIQSLFLAAFQAVAAHTGQSPSGMAMFTTRDMAAPWAFYYFSPPTEVLAPEFLRVVRAKPWEEPAEAISFQAGDEGARRDFATDAQ